LYIIKGFTTPLDLWKISQKGETPIWGFLSVSWSVVADVDYESGKVRSSHL
jgi:hypothetical protein